MSEEKSFLINELPESVAKLIEGDIGPVVDLKVAMKGDMCSDGSFGTVWLVMNDTKIGVFSNDKAPKLLSVHELEQVESLQVVPGISSAVIETNNKGKRFRLLRISNMLQKDFSEAVRMINTFIKDEEWKPETIDAKRHVCTTCGQPLPENMNVCPKCVDKRLMLKKVLVFLKPYKLLAGILFGLLILTTLLGLVTPYIVEKLVDDVLVPKQNFSWIPFLVGGMVLVCFLQSLVDMFSMRTSARLGTSAIYDIRAALFKKLQEQSLMFYSKHKTGGIITRVNQDTQQMQALLVNFIPMTLGGLIMLVGTLAILIYLSWFLTLFIIFPVAGAGVFIYLIFPRFRIYWERFFEKRSKLASMVENVVNGMRVVKAFAQEDSEISRFDQGSIEYRDAAYSVEKRWAQTMPILHFIIMLSTPIVWLVGGILYFRGAISLGEIIAYLSYVGMLFRPVFILSRLAEIIPNTLAAAGRVFDVMDADPDIIDSDDAIAMPNIKGEIEFKNVSFGYDANKPVLNDVSVKIKPKEMIGLVGHSGAGKSTTINLVCRFFDVNAGEVLVDGVDIRNIKYDDLRSQIGLVMQETFLMNGSIAENIAYAKSGASLVDVIKAAKAANAHDFIMNKPDGYDTEITGGGKNLSTGEKQRISIARAVLSDPKILILDEATASVDLETEKQIQDAIAEMVKKRTTIVIAHRLSTLRSADRLMVLDKGKLAELGTHEELLDKKDGVYSKLVKLHNDTSGIRVVDG